MRLRYDPNDDRKTRVEGLVVVMEWETEQGWYAPLPGCVIRNIVLVPEHSGGCWAIESGTTLAHAQAEDLAFANAWAGQSAEGIGGMVEIETDLEAGLAALALSGLDMEYTKILEKYHGRNK